MNIHFYINWTKKLILLYVDFFISDSMNLYIYIHKQFKNKKVVLYEEFKFKNV